MPYSYPRNGAYAISGGAGFDQTYPSAADQERIGKLHIAVLGGNTAGNFYPNAGGYTRQQIYQSMKNYSATYGTGLKLYQYVNYNEGPIGSPSDGWNVAVNANNWWLYQSGTSGPKSRSGFDPNFSLINMTHFSPQASGLYPYQWAANWTYQYLIANSGPDQATALDGFYVDNLFPYSANHSPDPTDYSRVGNPSLVTDTDFQNGQADFMNYGRGTVDATRGWGGNWFYSPPGYSYPAPPFNNNLDIALMENSLGWDQFLNSPSYEWYQSTATYLYVYTQACSNTFKTSNTYMVVDCVGLDSTGNIPNYTALNGTPYQGVRYNMALVAMGDGFFYDDGTSLHTSGPTDCRDWDERTGGTLNINGWLGAALEGQQTSPRISGSVYYRDFQYGRVYLNAKEGSAVTVDLTGFRRLSSKGTGYGNATINNGVDGGSFTIQPGDGLFVIRTGATPAITVTSTVGDGVDVSASNVTITAPSITVVSTATSGPDIMNAAATVVGTSTVTATWVGSGYYLYKSDAQQWGKYIGLTVNGNTAGMVISTVEFEHELRTRF